MFNVEQVASVIIDPLNCEYYVQLKNGEVCEYYRIFESYDDLLPLLIVTHASCDIQFINTHLCTFYCPFCDTYHDSLEDALECITKHLNCDEYIAIQFLVALHNNENCRIMNILQDFLNNTFKHLKIKASISGDYQEFYNVTLTIASKSLLTDKDIQDIIETIRAVLNHDEIEVCKVWYYEQNETYIRVTLKNYLDKVKINVFDK